MTEVLHHVTGHVATVTLNRPQRRNAISSTLLASLRELLAELDAPAQVTRMQARQIEATAHARFHRQGIDTEQVAQRRAAVIARGRSQS